MPLSRANPAVPGETASLRESPRPVNRRGLRPASGEPAVSILRCRSPRSPTRPPSSPRRHPCSCATRPANNLPLGIAQQLVDRPGSYDQAHFWVADEAGEVVGAAIADPALSRDPRGPRARRGGRRLRRRPRRGAARPSGRHGERAVGPPVRRGMEVRHRCRLAPRPRSGRLRPHTRATPRPVPGAARSATSDDRALLERWLRAFGDEALQAMPRDESGDRYGAIEARIGPGAAGGFTSGRSATAPSR